MSPALWIAGGEPALRRAVEEAAASESIIVRDHTDGGAALDEGDVLLDLGLPPAEMVGGVDLVESERKRAESIRAALPDAARVIRWSVFGADPEARTVLRKANGVAEATYRERRPDVVALRTGPVLGECGFSLGVRRAVERLWIVPLPAGPTTKLEPVAIEDFAAYAVAAATADSPLEPVYDLTCGEMMTNDLFVKGLAENLGLRRWVVPVPSFLRGVLAPLFASKEFPAPAVVAWWECFAEGRLLPRHLKAWEHFDVKPIEMRLAMANATGMAIPLRKKGEGRFGAWKKPEKKGILWRKSR